MADPALPSALLPYVYTFLKENGYKKTAKYLKNEAEVRSCGLTVQLTVRDKSGIDLRSEISLNKAHAWS